MPKGKQAINEQIDRQRREWIKQNTVEILRVRMSAEGITSTREVSIVARYERGQDLEPDYYELYDGKVLLSDPLWEYPTIETAKFFLRDTYNWSK